MKTKKIECNRITDRVDALVAEAYGIGHDHGGNAMRMALKQPLRSLDKGWGPVADKIKRLMARGVK